jgi:hypothetical protein
MSRSIGVFGVGPGLGQALARRYAREGRSPRGLPARAGVRRARATHGIAHVAARDAASASTQTTNRGAFMEQSGRNPRPQGANRDVAKK